MVCSSTNDCRRINSSPGVVAIALMCRGSDVAVAPIIPTSSLFTDTNAGINDTAHVSLALCSSIFSEWKYTIAPVKIPGRGKMQMIYTPYFPPNEVLLPHRRQKTESLYLRLKVEEQLDTPPSFTASSHPSQPGSGNSDRTDRSPALPSLRSRHLAPFMFPQNFRSQRTGMRYLSQVVQRNRTLKILNSCEDIGSGGAG